MKNKSLKKSKILKNIEESVGKLENILNKIKNLKKKEKCLRTLNKLKMTNVGLKYMTAFYVSGRFL